MIKKYIYFLIIFLFFACKSQDCPEKHSDLNNSRYEKYCSMLKNSRAKKDYFWEAIALCNLKQEPKKVYKLLHKSIRQHDTLCYQIYDYQRLHITGILTTNIVKADTVQWEKICKECEKIMPIENFYKNQEQLKLANLKKKQLVEATLDTNLIDKKLVAILKEIAIKDQIIRKIPFMNPQNSRWREQKRLDSLNLIQIDNIFKAENGYPSIEKVGYDFVGTPWLVLHHQTPISIRKKYLPYIEEAVKKGYINQYMLEAYNERTLFTEEYEKRKK
jgi:hypothetical protein